MYDNYNYPEGADGPDAPWNQEDLKPIKIEATISVTLSKTVEVYINDYKEEYDSETKDISYDFSECDLNKAVEEQITLPQDKFKDWDVDDFEVIKE